MSRLKSIDQKCWRKTFGGIKVEIYCPRELSSVDKDNTSYMQGLEFKPQPPQKKLKFIYWE